MVENSKKVSFNIASEASYVYNLGLQKLIKNAKNSHLASLRSKLKQCYQTGHFLSAKNWSKRPKCPKFKCDSLSNFQPMLDFFLWFSTTVLELPERDHDWVLDSFCQGRAKSQYGSDYWRATGYQSWAWGRLLQQLLQLCDICRTHRVCTGFAHPWSW